MEQATSSKKKIIIIIISVIILIIIGVIIYQSTQKPKTTTTPTSTTKTTGSKVATTQPTSSSDLCTTGTSSTTGTALKGYSCCGTSGGYCTSGTSGSNGINGRDGTNGTNGTNGIDGTNGTDGIDGIDGADGADGATGPAGPPGPPGPAGDSGTSGDDGDDGDSGDSGDGGDGGVYGTFAENTTPKQDGPNPSSATIDAELWTDISAEITLKVDWGTVVLSYNPGNGAGSFLDGVTGGYVTGSHTWTVLTNNTSGYTLDLKEMTGAKSGGGTTGALTNTSDASYEFLPFSSGNPHTWITPSAGNTAFGYMPTNITGNANSYSSGFNGANYYKVTGSDYEIMSSNSESLEAGDTIDLYWRAEFTADTGVYLKTGTYKEFITVTAAVQ